MKTIRIYCKACSVRVTDELEEVNENTLNFNVGGEVIAQNKFAVLTSNNKKELIVALEDYFLKNHDDPSRFNGCCGSDGAGGMNKLCANGHEVATEFSDCWTSYYIKFNLSKIIVKEIIDDSTIRVIRF